MAFGHEKLRVYQIGLEFAAWTHSVLPHIDRVAAVLDHWDRAAESVIENIANGNSRRARADRNRYFDVAMGSALECAACLDICVCREMITMDVQTQGKRMLHPVVGMTIGLRNAHSNHVREDRAAYAAGPNDDISFAHESLDAYKAALELVVWFDKFVKATAIGSSYATRLDKCTTSLVLNIAEGNGHFSKADQARFLDIAHTAAMRVAASLDSLTARRQVEIHQIKDGKRILTHIVPLLLGLRRSLDKSSPQSPS